MEQLLRRGQKVKATTSNMDCEVGDFLGGGGQGEVYRAVINGQKVALKWYYSKQATPTQQESLEKLIDKGTPSDKFLWPAELTTSGTTPGFGYYMPLREPHYKNIVDLMKRRCEPSYSALATAGRILADSFLQLHSKGLCYCDISFGNVFFEPSNGDILICDNDNVGIDGVTPVNVLGTPRFMAPEIVRGDIDRPSTNTDLFSLAVLLFYMFMIHHPLEGAKEDSIKCLDAPAMKKLYGTEAVFIFDPNDHSNSPIKGRHDNALQNWPIYPKFLKDLFIQSFTEGVKDPQSGRVREPTWRWAFTRLGDSVIHCNHCGNENLYDEEVVAAGEKLSPCWNCKREVQLPPRIRVNKKIVMLSGKAKLYPHHVDDKRPYDFSKPIAEMVQHPQNPKIWGLKNLSAEKWSVTNKDGSVKDVEPGKSVALANELKINFGKTEGEIRAN